MERTIIHGPGFCAVTEDEMLVEYVPEDNEQQYGDILIGKVDRLMAGLNCAFVDIGRKKNGFLALEELSKSFQSDKLRSGKKCTVQIKKEETGAKGAFLTRDITLPGTFVILMPMNRYVGVSGRITDEAVRERLKLTGKEIAGNRFGLVLRKAAEKADIGDVRREAEALYEQWQDIEKEAASGGNPGKILHSGRMLERLKEDYSLTGTALVREEDAIPHEIADQLRKAMERTIRLPGGGNIVIDRCEAMTVIDVNTASFSGAGSKQQTILETNLEACPLIAQQIRLRNISGIILIDFIDMDSKSDRSLVTNELSECFRNDRIKTVIHGWTSLGLLEMTRKRTRASLYEELSVPCADCEGKGYRIREQKE